MDTAIFSLDGIHFLLRWLHLLAGVTWIGLLYYFNFVQGEFFKETDPNTKKGAVQKLVPRALWWFRWSAMVTFLSGFIYLMMRGHMAGTFEIFAYSSWGIFILTGAALGTLMFLNVWLIIWPNQKVVIAAANGENIGDAAVAGARAGLASRTNVLFSIPMLFFMGAASHLPLSLGETYSGSMLASVLGLVIAALELNAIKGKTGPLTSINGVITCAVILTVVMYGIVEVLT